MIVKVIIITISIAICSGDILPHAMREPPHKQAISSVNFLRQDEPMGYKYNSYHPPVLSHSNYENNPHRYQPSPTPSPPNLRKIQYAPLIKPAELQFKNSKFNEVHAHNTHNFLDPTTFKLEETPPPDIKKHLEPKLELPSKSLGDNNLRNLQTHSLSHLDFLPGHNIEVLRSVIRSPGHNAVYRSYTDRNQEADKQKKINYLNQYNVGQRGNDLTTKIWVTTENSTVTTPRTMTTKPPTNTTPSNMTTKPSTHNAAKPYVRTYERPKQYYIPKPITYIVEKPIAAEKAPYTKMHSLMLNVARAYNLAMVPYKALHAGANPTLLRKLNNFGHSYQQNRKPPISVPLSATLHARTPLSNQKTVLYPVQKNLRYGIYT